MNNSKITPWHIAQLDIQRRQRQPYVSPAARALLALLTTPLDADPLAAPFAPPAPAPPEPAAAPQSPQASLGARLKQLILSKDIRAHLLGWHMGLRPTESGASGGLPAGTSSNAADTGPSGFSNPATGSFPASPGAAFLASLDTFRSAFAALSIPPLPRGTSDAARDWPSESEPFDAASRSENPLVTTGSAGTAVSTSPVRQRPIKNEIRVRVEPRVEQFEDQMVLMARRMAESVVNRVLTTRDVALNWLRKNR